MFRVKIEGPPEFAQGGFLEGSDLRGLCESRGLRITLPSVLYETLSDAVMELAKHQLTEVGIGSTINRLGLTAIERDFSNYAFALGYIGDDVAQVSPDAANLITALGDAEVLDHLKSLTRWTNNSDRAAKVSAELKALKQRFKGPSHRVAAPQLALEALAGFAERISATIDQESRLAVTRARIGAVVEPLLKSLPLSASIRLECGYSRSVDQRITFDWPVPFEIRLNDTTRMARQLARAVYRLRKK